MTEPTGPVVADVIEGDQPLTWDPDAGDCDWTIGFGALREGADRVDVRGEWDFVVYCACGIESAVRAIIQPRPAPPPLVVPGTRGEDGGVMGTIIVCPPCDDGQMPDGSTCEQCDGSGVLHSPDNLPPLAEPMDEDPPPPLAVGVGVRWQLRGEADYAWVTGLDVAVGNSSYVRGISPHDKGVLLKYDEITTVPPEQMPDWQSPVEGFESFIVLPDGTRKYVPPEVAEEVHISIKGGVSPFLRLKRHGNWAVKWRGDGVYGMDDDQAALLVRALTRGGGA